MIPTAPRQQRLRCVIVSDHALLADLLALTVTTAPDFTLEIVNIAASTSGGIAACDHHRPDVVLLDLGLRDGPGIRVAEHVVATLPESQVIVVSRHGGADGGPERHELVANGIARQAGNFDDLQLILADVQAPAGRGGKRETPASRDRRLASMLSRRERQVLALIGQRLSSREIAERLAIALNTVNTHRKNIARKLGIKGVSLALVAYEHREQLIAIRC